MVALLYLGSMGNAVPLVSFKQNSMEAMLEGPSSSVASHVYRKWLMVNEGFPPAKGLPEFDLKINRMLGALFLMGTQNRAGVGSFSPSLSMARTENTKFRESFPKGICMGKTESVRVV